MKKQQIITLYEVNGIGEEEIAAMLETEIEIVQAVLKAHSALWRSRNGEKGEDLLNDVDKKEALIIMQEIMRDPNVNAGVRSANAWKLYEEAIGRNAERVNANKATINSITEAAAALNRTLRAMRANRKLMRVNIESPPPAKEEILEGVPA